jgi:hypothetical protein
MASWVALGMEWMSGKLNDVQARNKITQTTFYQAACHSVSQAMPVIDIFAEETAAYANADKVQSAPCRT